MNSLSRIILFLLLLGLMFVVGMATAFRLIGKDYSALKDQVQVNTENIGELRDFLMRVQTRAAGPSPNVI